MAANKINTKNAKNRAVLAKIISAKPTPFLPGEGGKLFDTVASLVRVEDLLSLTIVSENVDISNPVKRLKSVLLRHTITAIYLRFITTEIQKVGQQIITPTARPSSS